MSLENPCTRIRKATGHTIHSFANLLQLSAPIVTCAEMGSSKKSPKLFKALAALGLGDEEALQAEYAAWYQEKSQRAREKITASRGGEPV